MTIDAFEQAAEHPVMGIGPYTIPHPYADGAITVSVIIDGAPVMLASTDYTVTPATSDSEGNVFLTVAAALAHDGRKLWIDRETPALQIWEARSGEREVGMEAQLDRLTMGLQELQARAGGAVRVRGAIAPVVPSPGRVLIWGDGRVDAGPTAAEITAAEGHAETAQHASAQAALFAGPWLDDVAALISDMVLTYTAGSAASVMTGQIVRTRREGFAYVVMPAGTEFGPAGYHLATAGGVLLRAINGQCGLSVKMLGAGLGDPAKDTAALVLAFQIGGHIHIPAGTYAANADLSSSGSITLTGDGISQSIVTFSGSHGWAHDGGSGGDHYAMAHARIDGVRFQTTGAPAYIAKLHWSGGSGGTAKSVSISNAEFISATPGATFGIGLLLENARNVWLENVRVLGDRDAAPIASLTGVRITGEADAAPVEIFMSGVQIYFVQTAISIVGFCEGVYLDQCTAIACRNGVVTNLSPAPRPLLLIDQSHFNVSTFGVLTVGNSQVNITANSFYATDVEGLSPQYVGVQINGTTLTLDSRIDGNDFQVVSPALNPIGVYVNDDGTTDGSCRISDNSFRGHATGIAAPVAATGIVVADDNRFFGVATPVSVPAAGNQNCLAARSATSVRKVHPDGAITYAGQAVVVLDASGNGIIPLSPAFPAAIASALVANGDATVAAAAACAFSILSRSLSQIGFAVRPNPGAITVRVDYCVTGY